MRNIAVNKWLKGESNKEKMTLPSALLLHCLPERESSLSEHPQLSAVSFVLHAERARPTFTNPFPLSL